MQAPVLPDETPHTPHGRQLVAGFRSLRFIPELEGEYRSAALQGSTYPTLIATLAGTAVWLVFVGIDLARLDLVQRFPDWPPPLWQLVAMRALVLLAFVMCAVALWSGRGLYRQRVLVAGMFFLLALGSGACTAVYLALGEHIESYVLALVVMAIFLPLGLGFFEAAALALACTAAVAVVGLVMLQGAAQAAFLQLPVILLVTGVVSAIGAYLREYAQRGQFLLLRELQWQAARDPLTGLFNRRVFTRHLGAAIRQARQETRTVMLLMLDVDHFKPYNDTYGHQAGDQALQRLARVLERLANRPMDLAFRMGGEELGLVLYDATVQDAHALGLQLLNDVDQLAIAHVASTPCGRLSVSAGCALLRPDEMAESLDRRADQLLYKAKSLGRNCVALDPALGGHVLHAQPHGSDAAVVAAVAAAG